MSDEINTAPPEVVRRLQLEVAALSSHPKRPNVVSKLFDAQDDVLADTVSTIVGAAYAAFLCCIITPADAIKPRAVTIRIGPLNSILNTHSFHPPQGIHNDFAENWA